MSFEINEDQIKKKNVVSTFYAITFILVVLKKGL